MPERFIVNRDLADEGEEAEAAMPHAAPWRPRDVFNCEHKEKLPVPGTSAVECVRCRTTFMPWAEFMGMVFES